MLRLDWPVKENEIDDSSALEVDSSTTAMAFADVVAGNAVAVIPIGTAMAAFGIAAFEFFVLIDIMSNRFELFDEDFATSGPDDDGWLIQ